jgi:predicted NBD/HSP70 family sugar kinase
VPGSYDPRTDVLHHVDVAGWARSGILAEIRARLGLAPGATVAIENDVKLAAIAERHRGVATGTDSFCLFWLGSGVGLATDLGGTLLRGSRGGAGEIGYLPLCAGHAPGWSRGANDLQDLLGGDAVIELAASSGIKADTAAEAVATAAKGDHDQFFRQLANRIAFALATVIAVLEPPLVVLAGEVAQAGGARLRDAVAEAIRSNPPTTNTAASLAESQASGHPVFDVQIAVTAVHDDAVLLGGLDAGLSALHESLISSLAQPSID